MFFSQSPAEPLNMYVHGMTLSPLSITHFAMVIYVWLVLARKYQFFTSAFYFVTSDSFPPVDSENSLTLI